MDKLDLSGVSDLLDRDKKILELIDTFFNEKLSIFDNITFFKKKYGFSCYEASKYMWWYISNDLKDEDKKKYGKSYFFKTSNELIYKYTLQCTLKNKETENLFKNNPISIGVIDNKEFFIILDEYSRITGFSFDIYFKDNLMNYQEDKVIHTLYIEFNHEDVDVDRKKIYVNLDVFKIHNDAKQMDITWNPQKPTSKEIYEFIKINLKDFIRETIKQAFNKSLIDPNKN